MSFATMYKQTSHKKSPSLQDGVSIFYECLRQYGTFSLGVDSLTVFDFDAFVRAYSLAAGKGVEVISRPRTTGPIEWDPYTGHITGSRSRNLEDVRRLLFRSLAQPKPRIILETKICTQNSLEVDLQEAKASQIAVVLFKESLKFLPDSWDVDYDAEIVEIVEYQDERYADLLDVLVHSPPRSESCGRVIKPPRESYQVVLDRLPGHERHLSELYIPRHNFFELMKLSLAVHTGDVFKSAAEGSTREGNSDSVVESLCDTFVGPENGGVEWMTFNTPLPTAVVRTPAYFLVTSSS